jgi:phosphate transport system protein
VAVAPLPEQREVLSGLLSQMCTAAGEALRLATAALVNEQERLALRVQASDAEIDALRARVEEIAFESMALHAPVAGDLRAIVAAIRCAGDIERMGDLAKHVAATAARQARGTLVPSTAREVLVEMARLGCAMAAKAAEVARTRNVILAIELDSDDDAMDRLLRDVFAMLLDPAWDHGIGAAVEVTLLARYYERFADHAVSVAKEVVYTVTGKPPESLAL